MADIPNDWIPNALRQEILVQLGHDPVLWRLVVKAAALCHLAYDAPKKVSAVMVLKVARQLLREAIFWTHIKATLHAVRQKTIVFCTSCKTKAEYSPAKERNSLQ